MKALYLLLVLTLISAFYSRECEGLAQKASECNQADFNTTIFYRCCFIEAEMSMAGSEITVRACSPVTKIMFDNVTALIEEATKEMKKQIPADFKVRVDCTSNYINISILFLILLLL